MLVMVLRSVDVLWDGPESQIPLRLLQQTRLLAGRAASCRRRHIQTAQSVCLCRSPGLEEEVVGDVGLRVQKGLQVALPTYKLTLPQSQAPLLDVHDHWIRQVALHHKQRAENHLEEQVST